MSELGIYFRAKRDDHWENIDILDLTEKELHEVLDNKNPVFLINLVVLLLKVIKGEEQV